MTIRTKRIIVDILMTVCFILSFDIRWPVLGGNLIFHIVAGSATAVLFAVHVWINRQWLISVGKSRRAGKLSKKTKRQYGIDIALLIVWSINIVAGLITMGYSIAEPGVSNGFRSLHSLTATVGLVLIIVHVIQHARTIRSYVGRKKSV